MLTNWGTISNSIKKLKKLETDLVAENRDLQKELLKMSVKKINFKDHSEEFLR